MGLYASEENGDKVDVCDGFLMVRRPRRGDIEVWCEDAEVEFGRVPVDWTSADVEVALKFRNTGFVEGLKEGKRLNAHEIAAALGIGG